MLLNSSEIYFEPRITYIYGILAYSQRIDSSFRTIFVHFYFTCYLCMVTFFGIGYVYKYKNIIIYILDEKNL